jgi:hypothetical protein
MHADSMVRATRPTPLSLSKHGLSETSMNTHYVCDSHVVEPPEVFAGLNSPLAPVPLKSSRIHKVYGEYIAFGKTISLCGNDGQGRDEENE